MFLVTALPDQVDSVTQFSEDWICSQRSISSLLIVSHASHVVWAATVLSEAWSAQLSKHEENNFFFFKIL